MVEFQSPGKPPERIGNYRILDHLGEGGMGVVYLAFDESLGRRVALKWLKQATPATMERLRQEAHLHARVEHPAVCRLYQVAEWEGWPYLVMQLISGQTLDKVAPSLPLVTKLRLMATLADGVHAAHRQGLIHRDLKPTNLMVEADEAGGWRPYVMDFGLARDEASGSLTQAGMILGSPSYMAPEQVTGGWIDARTDVYGLGAALFEVLTGRPPFQGQAAEILVQVQTQDPPRLRELVPESSKDLETVVQTSLARDPARRYPSVAAFRDDLLRLLDGEPVKARPASLAYRLGKRILKNKALAGVAFGSTLIILTLSALELTRAFRASAQAQSAQRFGREAERMEALLFKAYSLPLHDIRPERDQVLARIDRIRQELSNQGGWSQAAGRLAIGRGLMALGRFEEARTELEIAWRASHEQDPDIAQALGLTLARLYQQELEGLFGQPRENRKKELENDLLRPARELLRRAKGLKSENTAYVEAVLALVEERPDQALALTREAQHRLPWFFEAWVLEADLHRYWANTHIARGLFSDAESCLEDSRVALTQAMNIARSAPLAYQSEVQRRMTRFQLHMDQGQQTQEERDWAMEAVDQALKADPDNWRVMAFASAIHRRWGTALLESHEDPRPALEEAISMAEAGLRQRPSDTPLLNNLGTALRYKADWENELGLDPRRTLSKAVEALQKAMDRPAFRDSLLNNLGNCHSLQATWEMSHGVDPTRSVDRASECFQKASALRPWVGHANSEAMTHLDQATFLCWQGKNPQFAFESALRAVNEALRLKPNSYRAHLCKAEIHLARAGAVSTSPRCADEDRLLAMRHFDLAKHWNDGLAAQTKVRKAHAMALGAASSRASKDISEAKMLFESLSHTPLRGDLALAWAEAVACFPDASSALIHSALQSEEMAHANHPWDARLRLQRGRLLLLLGNKHEGSGALKEAVRLNANLRPLVEQLSH